MGRTPPSIPPAGARAWPGLLLVLALLVGGGLPARAEDPLFSFAQISDSQPQLEADWTLFEQVLDTIAGAGSPGALLPRPVDFVLFAGDLVSHAKRQEEWVRFVDTIDARLTANAIPYRAVPGNHDVDAESGVGFYELFIGDAGVWDTDSATVVGQNGPVVHTGWSGLRIIGFNNSNGAWNQISPEDLVEISERVTAAAAAGQNAFLLGHHPHDEQGAIPLAGVLESPSVCCYARGHSGSVGARRGLAGVANPDVWDLNSNKIVEAGAILYYEVYATQLRVYALQLATSPTALPSPKNVPLAHALVPAAPAAQAQTLRFAASADAQVRSSSPSRNYGSDPELRVRAGDPTYRSYLRFSVSGLGGASVLSAKLRLFATEGSDDGGALYPVASDWTEGGITWSNAPAIGGAPLAGPAPVVAGQWREIDVGALVRGEGSYAFALDSASSNSAYYSSREGVGAPELVVELAPAAVPQAEFGGTPTEGPAPLDVHFTDLSTDAPTSWLWDFGDGATSTLQHPSHTYAAAGVYDVSLTASNASGSTTVVYPALVRVSGPEPTLRTLAPAADAMVGAAKPTRNYGSDPELRVKHDAWRSFLRFDVAGLGAPVERATLRLFVNAGARDGGALYAVTGAWSESQVTWNTAPPLQGAPLAQLGPVATGTWVEVDVTAAIAGDGSYGFGLENAASVSVYYGSRESATPPELVIELAP
jgi:PKD repeat protein